VLARVHIFADFKNFKIMGRAPGSCPFSDTYLRDKVWNSISLEISLQKHTVLLSRTWDSRTRTRTRTRTWAGINTNM